MQLPILKDGLVVNVIVIGEDVAVMSKAECRQQEADEVAEYLAARESWSQEVAVRRAEVAEAYEAIIVGTATLEDVEALEADPLPPKPVLVRAPRWWPPEGHAVGPPGGNIGDLWDGQQYVAPEGKSGGPDPQ